MSEAQVTPETAQPGKPAPEPAAAANPPDPPPKWTDADRDEARAWVAKYAPILRLGDIPIEIEFRDAPATGYDEGEDVVAETAAQWPYRGGDILRLFPLYLKKTTARREWIIIHELLHIVTHPTFKALRQVLSKEQLVTWRDAYDRNELVTDHLTSIIVGLVKSTSSD